MASLGSFRRLFSTQTVRRMVTNAEQSDFKKHLLEEELHSGGLWVTWRRIAFFVAIPGILFCMWNAYEKEKKHASHVRPEFIPYDHMRVRRKPFPWGDGNHSLFHNSHVNALPEGYEDEIEA